MILLLSPSKTLDFDSHLPIKTHSQPGLLSDSKILISQLKKLKKEYIAQLMDLSDKLATLNTERYQNFKTPFTPENARQALLAFKGDVYEGLAAETFSAKDFAYAQEHLRILSGLYGLLRPLDLIQPYRLEMGTRLVTMRGKDLYTFWGDRITGSLNSALESHKNKLVINLASEEYFSAVKPAKVDGEVLHITFKENHKGALKIIGIHAKKARGMMASYIIRNRIESVSAIKKFSEAGYEHQPTLSSKHELVFVR